RGPRLSREDIVNGERPDIRRRVESRPLLRGPGHQHVHFLDLAAGKASVEGKVETGEGEGGPDGGRRLTKMLGAVGVDNVLMDERGITVGERVVRQLIHEVATLTGGVCSSIRFQPEAGPLQAATRAHAQ